MIYKEDVKKALAISTILAVSAGAVFLTISHFRNEAISRIRNQVIVPEEAWTLDSGITLTKELDTAKFRKLAERDHIRSYGLTFLDQQHAPYLYTYYRWLNSGDSFHVYRVRRGMTYTVISSHDEWFPVVGTSGRFVGGDLYLTGDETELLRDSGRDIIDDEFGAEGTKNQQSKLYLTDSLNFFPNLK
jgi:hypothetical protein